MQIQVYVEDGSVAGSRGATYGCVPAIAAASAISEWVLGRTLHDAEAIDATELIELLGGLPEDRIFCAEMAVEALRVALHNSRHAA